MRKLLLDTAMAMMARGVTPSVAELAEEAGVARATAYRYFATQGELVSAVVDESLGPIRAWRSEGDDARERVDALLRSTYPRLEEYEVPLRAAILVSLQQGAQLRAGQPGAERAFVRGHRVDLLGEAAAPLRARVGDEAFQRVVRALSLLYGTETFLVLKDIWHLELDAILDVVRWTAGAILEQAEREAKEAAPAVAAPRVRATPRKRAAR